MTTTTHATIILTGGHGSRLGTTNKAELPLAPPPSLTTSSPPSPPSTTPPSSLAHHPTHPPTYPSSPPKNTPTHRSTRRHRSRHHPPPTPDHLHHNPRLRHPPCSPRHHPLTHALTTTHQDAALAVDKEGRWQPLVAVYDVAALATALDALRDSGGLAHRPVKHLIAALNITTVPLPQLWTFDVDTPQDYSQMRSLTTSERAHTTGEDPDDDAI